MNTNEYGEYIKRLIPASFSNIYIIDVMADLVSEYEYDGETLKCKDTFPFTSFYDTLEHDIHPEDLGGYIDSISINSLKLKLQNTYDYIRYEYRKKSENGYDWYSNVIRLVEAGGKSVCLVFVENINENVKNESADEKESVENLKSREKLIFDTLSNAIINLNGVININYASNNAEVKSMSTYISNVITELTNSFPELSKALTNNMIVSTNQGKTKTIVVVDDDNVTCNLISKTFEDSYKVVVAHNGQEAIDILEKNNDVSNLETKDKIVGMFLDLNMPVVDGFGVLDYMSSKNLLMKLPVIIISGDYDQETRDRSYNYPIADVLEKPFNVQVVKHRIGTLIKLYKSNNLLNEIVLNQHEEIKNVLKNIVKSYMYDNANDLRVISNCVKLLITQVSEDYQEYKFDNERIEKVVEAVKYYNIGFYVLPQKMFIKSELNDDEIKILRSHPFIGVTIFDSILYRNIDRIFNHYAKDIIKYCNEKYDGTGYPHGIKGDDIPVVAQVAAVAIEYNRLIKNMDSASAIAEISKKAGTSFNPKIVESLKRTSSKMQELNGR